MNSNFYLGGESEEDELPNVFTSSCSISTEDTSDCVEFIVGDNNIMTIEGHKSKFSTASDVFYAMFNGGFKEDKVIRITDLDPEGFLGLKQFIYTGKPTIKSIFHAISIYAAANKYLMPKLCNECLTYFISNLTPSLVFPVHEKCWTMHLTELEELCCHFIRITMSEVLNNDAFLSAKACTIYLIVRSKFDYPIYSVPEIEIFKHFERWVLAEAKRSEILDGDVATDPLVNYLKKHIRFLNMSSKDFVSSVGDTLLLTKEEKDSILSNIIKFGSKPIPETISTLRIGRTRTRKLRGIILLDPLRLKYNDDKKFLKENV